MAITSAEAIVRHTHTAAARTANSWRHAYSGEDRSTDKAKLMPSKANTTTAASFRRRSHRMDPAMKAGIGATICSVLILGLVLLVMQTLPISIG